MIACFLGNISAKYYKNPSMLSRVIAENVIDVFICPMRQQHWTDYKIGLCVCQSVSQSVSQSANFGTPSISRERLKL